MKIVLFIIFLIYSSMSWAVFPAADIDQTTSLGRFSIRLTQAMGQQWLGIDSCPGNLDDPNDPCRINSPGLEDLETKIGRSAPHQDEDSTDRGGALISGALQPVKDSDFSFVPDDTFQEGPIGSQEIHTQVLSFHLKRSKACCDNPIACSSSDWLLTSDDATAVRAGSVAADQPRSIGEVESLGNSDFPAESFFNVFVEVDLDFDPDGPGPQQPDGTIDMTLFNKKPLVIQNDDVMELPPTVVYIHGGSDFAPLVYNKTTGEAVGWLTLAGHGVGYGCWTTPGPNEFDAIYFNLREKRILERVLTVEKIGQGSGTIVDNTEHLYCGDRCQGSYGQGTRVILEAMPDEGSVFSGWQQPECQQEIIMDTDKQCSAFFEPDPLSSPAVFLSPLTQTMQLTVKLVGSGRGQVYSEPNGIFCRHQQERLDHCRNHPSDFVFHCLRSQANHCIFDFDTATWVNLIAQAAPGSVFVGWGGHPGCAQSQFYMVNNFYCTAYFERLQPLTITQSGSGNGRIRSYNSGFQMTGIDCGQGHNQCYQEFTQNKHVILVATPTTQSRFLGWEGDCQGYQKTTFIKMDTAKQCQALFSQ